MYVNNFTEVSFKGVSLKRLLNKFAYISSIFWCILCVILLVILVFENASRTSNTELLEYPCIGYCQVLNEDNLSSDRTTIYYVYIDDEYSLSNNDVKRQNIISISSKEDDIIIKYDKENNKVYINRKLWGKIHYLGFTLGLSLYILVISIFVKLFTSN